MVVDHIARMRDARTLRCEFPFEVKELHRGYSDRILRIDLDKGEIAIQPVTQQMKDLWTGGKGFDLWLMFQEIDKNTKWDSPNNPLCFSPGPLGGTTSFPGSGKTLVTALSPLTSSVMDCNVGGFFGPFLKFAGFDALVIVGKATEETILVIDAVKQKITIETAPEEAIDSHVVAEELTEMYADDELDKRNIAVVSAGRAAQHTRMGVLNFSFWDWRRNVARLKQAGRGGVGTVFRNKNLKALVIKNRDITPAWRVEENKVAKNVKPKKIVTQCGDEVAEITAMIEKYGNDPEFVVEMMQDIQDRFKLVSRTAIDLLTDKTGTPTAYLYHIATFDPFFSLEEKAPEAVEDVKAGQFFTKDSILLAGKTAGESRDFNAYTAAGGYKTFEKLVKEKNEGIIDEVKKSGLIGRSTGAAVGLKWETALNAGKEKEEEVYFVCNTDSGHHDAFIGKSILEADPHAVIEGMLTGAYAVGAKKGYIITTKGHGTEKVVNAAIEAAKENGFLGEDILGSGFAFDIAVHRLGGAVVSGEHTALVTAMSGKAGESQAQYIPVENEGLHGKPTVVNNAETLANIPAILEKGAEWFKGAETKIFSITGNGKNGLVEVPMGASIKEILGLAGVSANVKAVQVGGAAGGCIPANLFDTKTDFASLLEAGASVGSGNIAILDENTCMVDKSALWLESLAAESCGKCTACREGLFALKNTMKLIAAGKGKAEDLQLLEDVAGTVARTSLCGFGTNAPKSLQSVLRYFKDELEAHVNHKKCAQGVCKMES